MNKKKDKEKSLKPKIWMRQFFEWLNEICFYGEYFNYCQILSEEDNVICKEGLSEKVRIHIFTHNYRYFIVAKENYLGCQYSCRKPRAGEDWTRGRDITDGEFNIETWRRIKNSIIKNELVKIAKQIRNQVEHSYDNKEEGSTKSEIESEKPTMRDPVKKLK